MFQGTSESKSRPAEQLSTELEGAAVVAVVRIRAKTERIAASFEGEDLGYSAGQLRTYFSHVADIVRLVHLNGRRPDDPDLVGAIEIEQLARERKGIQFELGHTYLLFLRRSIHWHWTPECSKACVLLPAPFELATAHGGYELKGTRLSVLRRGGPLDQFDRKTLDELAQALTKTRM